jgi:hypothetical protein
MVNSVGNFDPLYPMPMPPFQRPIAYAGTVGGPLTGAASAVPTGAGDAAESVPTDAAAVAGAADPAVGTSLGFSCATTIAVSIPPTAATTAATTTGLRHTDSVRSRPSTLPML